MSLLKQRGFLSYFAAMFLGAFNDNFFKSAIVMLITYRIADASSLPSAVLVASAAGVLILPFLLFSSLASRIADRYERSRTIRLIKLAEIAVMGLGSAAFFMGEPLIQLIVIFLMGTQSAFFGPLKYGVLPALASSDRLVEANGLVESATYMAILLGTVAGGLSVMTEHGLALSSACVVAIAAAGYAASFGIPKMMPPARGELEHRSAAAIVCGTMRRKNISVYVLASSWFYFIGAVFMSQFPIYAREVVGGDEQVATLFIAVFSIGIGAGSIACGRMLKGAITTRLVPASAVVIMIFGCVLALISPTPHTEGAPLAGALEVASSLRGLAMICVMFAISFFGGVYKVPIGACVQHFSGDGEIASVIACQNMIDSLFIVAASAYAAIAAACGVSLPALFASVSVMTGGVAVLFAKKRRSFSE